MRPRHRPDRARFAVHLAARIAALAGVDEVLVSSTVRDPTAGSGLSLVGRGVQALKGVPDRRQVFVKAFRIVVKSPSWPDEVHEGAGETDIEAGLEHCRGERA